MTVPTGLTQDEANARLRQYGPNRLPEPKAPGLATLFIRQFLSPFIYILMIAAVVSFAIGQVQDAGLIFLSKMSGDIADAMKDDAPEDWDLLDCMDGPVWEAFLESQQSTSAGAPVEVLTGLALGRYIGDVVGGWANTFG